MRYISSEISAFVMTWNQAKLNQEWSLKTSCSWPPLLAWILGSWRMFAEVLPRNHYKIVIIPSMQLHHFMSSLPLPAPLAHYHTQHQQRQQRARTSDSMTDDSWWGLPMVGLRCITLGIICHVKGKQFVSWRIEKTSGTHIPPEITSNSNTTTTDVTQNNIAASWSPTCSISGLPGGNGWKLLTSVMLQLYLRGVIHGHGWFFTWIYLDVYMRGIRERERERTYIIHVAMMDLLPLIPLIPEVRSSILDPVSRGKTRMIGLLCSLSLTMARKYE